MRSLSAILPEPLRWLRLTNRRPDAGPRFLVVGEHQAEAIGRAIGYLVPEAVVAVASAVSRRYRTLERIFSAFSHYDVVFLNADHPALEQLETAADLRRVGNVILVPTITFSGFHPDVLHIDTMAGAQICGPMGTSHSALVLFGYLTGLSPEEVAGLFCREVFERVGYFDEWDVAATHLRKLGARTGCDLDASLARWMRRGCFMHTVDRMKLYATADLARGLLDRAGVPYHPSNFEDFVPDRPDEAGCWPVYPEIAAHYGVPGSVLFLRPAGHADARQSPTMALNTFIEASFAFYNRQTKLALKCPRVAAWQADGELVTALQSITILNRAGA